jgi:dolichol-phosphate mannosyltransferase
MTEDESVRSVKLEPTLGKIASGPAPTGWRDAPEISVVIPVYFNAPSLRELYQRLSDVMNASRVNGWDVTFVNDGSSDDSDRVLEELRQSFPGVRVMTLSRNFGANAAVLAGLTRAKGKAVAVIAADLQDPPELLAQMIERWRNGVKVVVATRISRDDPPFTRLFAGLFYSVFRLLVSKDMPRGGFDFFLIDRKVAQLLIEFEEKNSNLPAAILWLGFNREFIGYQRSSRAHGHSMWTFAKKVKYLYDTLISFSYMPLRLMTGAGAVAVVLSIVYGLAILVKRLFNAGEPQGWASLMVITLFFSGLMLASIGMVGEYVWRTFDAARKRPPFVVDDCAEPVHQRVAASNGSEAPMALSRPSSK